MSFTPIAMLTIKMLRHLALFLSTSLLFAASAFSGEDLHLINCGFTAAKTLDADHRVFIADHRDRNHGFNLEATESSISGLSPLYSTAAVFHRRGSYVFPVVDRGLHHTVRLHFYPFENEFYSLFHAEFHVVANGLLLLGNFSVPGNVSLPVIKEFLIPVDSNEVKLSFVPSRNSKIGFVNAIEVISAPKDLIADVAQFIDVGVNERIYGLLRSGFEAVYRVNVGGFKLTPFNDSLWRTWVPDDEYLISGGASQPFHFSGHIKYRDGGASREVAPDNVYNTARVLRSSSPSVPNENVTWSFDVEKGYKYMVRMHFCDIASISLNSLYFNVYINEQLAYESLDLSDITSGQLASPFYADFVVDVKTSDNIVVSVGPSKISLSKGVDAILNGVEIWKMNNSMGSFDGDVTAAFVGRRIHLNRICALMPLIAAICLLIFLLHKQRDHQGWRHLPMTSSNYSK